MNIDTLRADFPILTQTIHGHPLAYLDNAATTQKPASVLKAMNDYYLYQNANIHRGVHHLSEKATEAFEGARQIVQRFINAPHAHECIFVKSTTEAINLVATSFGSRFIQAGDEIVISALEHHANIVPWQMLCQRAGATLQVLPMNEQGVLKWEDLEQYLSPKTKLLAITHASNALGTLNPLKAIIQKTQARHIPVLVDAAQTAAHLPIDVQALGCDFLTFSSHKAYGPTGVGVLYGKSQWLEAMPPYQGGGDMVLTVSFEKSTYQDLPYKFEAGTPPIAEVIGLGQALNYIQSLGWDAIFEHEQSLLRYASEQLNGLPGVKIIGTAADKIGVISFVVEGIHPHDIGSILDQYGVAIRTGHHCAMPIMQYFNIPATARLSLAVYNTKDDIDRCMAALLKAQQLFKRV